jgi:hypothetical protein
MRLTVDGWLASQPAEGLFPYGFDFLADSPLEPNRVSPSNLIRQAGTASALAQYYEYTRDARLEEPIRRAIVALGRHSLPSANRGRRLDRARAFCPSLCAVEAALLARTIGTAPHQSAGDGKLASPDGTYSTALAGCRRPQLAHRAPLCERLR